MTSPNGSSGSIQFIIDCVNSLKQEKVYKGMDCNTKEIRLVLPA